MVYLLERKTLGYQFLAIFTRLVEEEAGLSLIVVFLKLFIYSKDGS